MSIIFNFTHYLTYLNTIEDFIIYSTYKIFISGVHWTTVFSTPATITSLAMYSSDIGMVGTARNTEKLFYKYPGKWLSTSILLFNAYIKLLYDAVLIVPILTFATKYRNHAAISLSNCMRISIPLIFSLSISFVKKTRYKTYRIH